MKVKVRKENQNLGMAFVAAATIPKQSEATKGATAEDATLTRSVGAILRRQGNALELSRLTKSIAHLVSRRRARHMGSALHAAFPRVGRNASAHGLVGTLFLPVPRRMTRVLATLA